MTAHTPGKWVAMYLSGSAEGVIRTDDEHSQPVACVDRVTPESSAQEEANARLLAAAPELLATLKDAVAHLRSIPLDPGDDEDDAPALTAAEALIAKTEGHSA